MARRAHHDVRRLNSSRRLRWRQRSDPNSPDQLKAGGRTVIPVGLAGAQQLLVAEKDRNGKVVTKEIMPVLFSLLEGSEQPTFRAS
jgi:Protein-L-isoaspartate(D-aspartate) O-methyltransferase (PCMT)